MNAKIYRYLACGLLFMSFWGCAPTTSSMPTIIETLSPTSTSSFASTATAFSTETPLPIEGSSLKFFSPKIEKRCPENREVFVDKLGINQDLKIILSDQNQTGLWSLASENPSPQLIQKFPLDKWTNKSISPDGKRLAYTISNPDGSLSTRLLSLDSGEEHKIANIDYLEGASSSARWLSPNELVVVGSCAGSGCPFPLKVFNISNGKALDVYRTDRDPYDTYLGFYVSDGKYYALYSVGSGGDDYIDFYAYDYSTKQRIQIFPWLQDKIFFYPYGGTNLGMDFYSNKIFMMVEQSYGYDFGVVDASLQGLTQNTPYDLLMKRVVTDYYFSELDFSFVVLNPPNNTLLLSMSYKDYINGATNADFTTEPKNIVDAFFALDLDHPVLDRWVSYLIFTDYCFTTTGYYVNEISPDGKIVVLNSDDNIMLLNLETGYIAHLPNWRFVGWGKR